ncbi:hypothetical protein [Alteraurantiacibacter buctensis]|uniref:STAS domain-containing protein n=1 Tax=Alteraurantiacibacter buctensis TaxID=1503981 RepID=A0A844YXC0_9SPHN|nr:hypothetical protein [Alteraurantiacibacter buctensis]MXO71124.1 hypothetical protein [Alteraurantiacibacter buctensis]
MTTITLPPQCTREAALAVLAQAREQGTADLAIDGIAVESVGQAMLQVLLVVLGGRPLGSPSAALADMVRKVGLGPRLLEGAAQ